MPQILSFDYVIHNFSLCRHDFKVFNLSLNKLNIQILNKIKLFFQLNQIING